MKYRYREAGILPDGSKLPDIPVINLLFVRREQRRAFKASAVVDTGFDASIYSNLDFAEFLRGLHPALTRELEAPGHTIRSEVFRVECHLCDERWKPGVRLGNMDVFVPTEPDDITPDVLVGREVLNRMHMELDGRFLKVYAASSAKC